jgi:hypothetical protein
MEGNAVGNREEGCRHLIERLLLLRVEGPSRARVEAVERVRVARVDEVFAVDIELWCGSGIHGKQAKTQALVSWCVGREEEIGRKWVGWMI